MRWLCMLNVHDWETPWRLENKTKIYGDGWGNMTELPTRTVATYVTTCKHCGVLRTKRVDL